MIQDVVQQVDQAVVEDIFYVAQLVKVEQELVVKEVLEELLEIVQIQDQLVVAEVVENLL